VEFVNITGSAATQNRPTGLHCSLLYGSIVFSCCLLYFTLMFFALFAANFVIFSLLATILLNLNLNLTPKYINWEDSSAAFGLPLILLNLSRKKVCMSLAILFASTIFCMSAAIMWRIEIINVPSFEHKGMEQVKVGIW